MLEGRHGGLVGTKALGEENGPRLLYGYEFGFAISFSRNERMPINVPRYLHLDLSNMLCAI